MVAQIQRTLLNFIWTSLATWFFSISIVPINIFQESPWELEARCSSCIFVALTTWTTAVWKSFFISLHVQGPIRESGQHPPSLAQREALYSAIACRLLKLQIFILRGKKTERFFHKSWKRRALRHSTTVSTVQSLWGVLINFYQLLATQFWVIQGGFPTLRKKLVITSCVVPTNYSVLWVQLMKSFERFIMYDMYPPSPSVWYKTWFMQNCQDFYVCVAGTWHASTAVHYLTLGMEFSQRVIVVLAWLCKIYFSGLMLSKDVADCILKGTSNINLLLPLPCWITSRFNHMATDVCPKTSLCPHPYKSLILKWQIKNSWIRIEIRWNLL